MALLTTAYDPNSANAAVQSAIRLSSELREAQARAQETARQRKEAQRTQQIQDDRRAFEFDRRLEFERAKAEADDSRADKLLDIQLAENRPFTFTPGGFINPLTGPVSPPAVRTGNPASPSVPTSYAPPALPSNDPLDEPAAPVPDVVGPGGVQLGPPVPPSVPQLAPLPPPPDARPSPGGVGAATMPGQVIPDLPARPVTPADTLNQTAQALAGMGFSTKNAKAVLSNVASAAFSAQARQTGTSSAEMSKWPINEHGYRFNPENPAAQFAETAGPKGSTFKQMKPTDAGYGLKPIGEGLFEDGNGARFFVDKVDGKGRESYKRVEEDAVVTARFKSADGRIRQLNRFGEEVAVTPEGIDFLTPKSKPMVGSDGKVYVFDGNKKGFITPPPPGVTFDGGKSTEAKRMMVGSDGAVYAFDRQGAAMTPIPEGVRFDKPKDPDAIAHWEVDEKSGDLHGFNFKGEKVAETAGDYAKLAQASGAGKTTMSDDATFQALEPKVRAMQDVNMQIIAAGVPITTSDADLISTLGEKGKLLAGARKSAQDAARAVASSITKRKQNSAEWAEAFVSGYVKRKNFEAPAATAPNPASASPAAPSAPVSPPAAAPAAPSPTPSQAAPAAAKGQTKWKIDKKTGIKWEVGPDGKLTGTHVKPSP